MIKEIIVVEGKDDIAAIKRAVDAEVIATGGFSLPISVMQRIKTAAQKRGVIIFTDPDFAGEKIRKIIASQLPNCKHAFLPKEEALKDGDIGIENASPASILLALKKARSQRIDKQENFTRQDLISYGLMGNNNASLRREKLGKVLGIGYGNAKQFLSRLNNYDITRDEFDQALKFLEE